MCSPLKSTPYTRIMRCFYLEVRRTHDCFDPCLFVIVRQGLKRLDDVVGMIGAIESSRVGISYSLRDIRPGIQQNQATKAW